MSQLRATRYRAHWVFPVTSAPVEDGAVLVDEAGRIAAVGPATAVPLPDEAADVNLGDAALLPGLVNVHGHPELTGFRGLLEDLPFHEWIPALNRLKQAATGGGGPGGAEADADAPPHELFAASARWTCVEALAAGITTLGATEDSGAALDAFLEAGVRGVIYREVFGPAPEQAEAALGRLRSRVERMRARETARVRIGISPHAPYTVSDQLFRMVAGYARIDALPVAVHAAESEAETLLVRNGAGPFAEGLRARGITTVPRARSTVELLDRLGILATRPLLVHCVQADHEDIRRMAGAGVAVAHCPAANARLGHGIAPVAEMLEVGVTVGLGTDSVASNNRLDPLEEARLAQLFQRARQRAAAVLPADRLLRLTTLDGARALGLDQRIGSLEPGKDADLCAVWLTGAHTVPVHDPLAAVFHSARATDVVLTAVQGQVLYRDGAWRSLDAETLRGRIEHAAAALRSCAAGGAPGAPGAAAVSPGVGSRIPGGAAPA